MAISRVLLITGPAGSGKSTLAQSVSQELGWECISEDGYWVKNGWSEGLRTEEQEEFIQHQVSEDLAAIFLLGRSAVLEFILYKKPPNPLTAYQELLQSIGTAHYTVALKPSVKELTTRLIKRGRQNDISNIDEKRRIAESQIECIDFESNGSTYVLDSSHMSIDDLTEKCVQIVSDK